MNNLSLEIFCDISFEEEEKIKCVTNRFEEVGFTDFIKKIETLFCIKVMVRYFFNRNFYIHESRKPKNCFTLQIKIAKLEELNLVPYVSESYIYDASSFITAFLFSENEFSSKINKMIFDTRINIFDDEKYQVFMANNFPK